MRPGQERAFYPFEDFSRARRPRAILLPLSRRAPAGALLFSPGKQTKAAVAMASAPRGPYVGAIDQGTTSSRFVLFGSTGEAVASCQVRLAAHAAPQSASRGNVHPSGVRVVAVGPVRRAVGCAGESGGFREYWERGEVLHRGARSPGALTRQRPPQGWAGDHVHPGSAEPCLAALGRRRRGRHAGTRWGRPCARSRRNPRSPGRPLRARTAKRG